MTPDEMILDAIQESSFKEPFKQKMRVRMNDLLLIEKENERLNEELLKLKSEIK